MTGAQDEIAELRFVRIVVHEEDVVETLARPLGVAQTLRRHQVDARALAFGLAQERLSLVKRRDAEQRDRLGHVVPSALAARATHRRANAGARSATGY